MSYRRLVDEHTTGEVIRALERRVRHVEGRRSTGGPPPRVADVIQDLAPSSFWRLDELTGNYADSGSGGITATAIANTRRGQRAPRTGRSVEKLNAGTGVLNAGNVYPFASRAAFTVACWLRPTGYAGNFSRVVVKEGQWILGVSGGTGEASAVRQGGVQLSSGVPVTIGEWNFVAMTYDGTTLRAYINGHSVTVTDTGNIPAASNPLYVGQHGSGGVGFSPPVGSRFAFPAIWTGALSVADLDSIWEAGA